MPLTTPLNRSILEKSTWVLNKQYVADFEQVDFTNPRMITARNERIYFISEDYTLCFIQPCPNFVLAPVAYDLNVESYHIFHKKIVQDSRTIDFVRDNVDFEIDNILVFTENPEEALVLLVNTYPYKS